MNDLLALIMLSALLSGLNGFAHPDLADISTEYRSKANIWVMEKSVGPPARDALAAQTTPDNALYPIENKSSNPGLVAGAVVLVLVIVAGVVIHTRWAKT